MVLPRVALLVAELYPEVGVGRAVFILPDEILSLKDINAYGVILLLDRFLDQSQGERSSSSVMTDD